MGADSRLDRTSTYERQRRSLQLTIALLLVIFVVEPNLAHALDRQDADRPVGIIVAIRSHQQHSSPSPLLRTADGAVRRLSEADLVYAGDEVSVPNHDASISVSMSRGTIVVCPGGVTNDPCVHAFEATGYFTIIGKVYDAVARLVAQSANRTGNAATLSSRSFEDAPSIASTKDQLLLSGRRLIWLNWLGGRPPFSVVLQGSKYRSISSSKTSGQDITLGPIDFKEGTYKITIRDSMNRPLFIALNVTNKVPTPPQSAHSSTNPTLAKFLSAIWLSQQDNGRLRLEAIQQLGEIEDAMPVSQTIKSELLLEP